MKRLSAHILDASFVPHPGYKQGLEIEVHVSEQRIWSFSSGLPCLIEFNLSLLQIASPVAYQPAAFSAQHVLPSGQGRRRAPAAAHNFSCC